MRAASDAGEGIQIHMPSSVIAAMQYHEPDRVLTILYRGKRGKYRYYNVPPEEWVSFQAAPSKGTYLNAVFKARDYRYEKVSDRAA